MAVTLLLGPLHPLLARLAPECGRRGSRRWESQWVWCESAVGGVGIIDAGMVKGRRNNELSPESRRDLRGVGMYYKAWLM